MSTTLPLFDHPRRANRYTADDITASRHRGSETSEEAHEAIREGKEAQRQRILELLASRGGYGATTEEASRLLSMRMTSVSARMAELKHDGRAVLSGCRRETTSGKSAAVVVLASLMENA